MNKKISLDKICIRSEVQPGDIESVVCLHGILYKKEYNYEIEFKNCVAKGLREFYNTYDPLFDHAQLCEHNNIIIASLFLVHRPGNASQLCYFLIKPEYHGIGLGKKLMELYLAFHHSCNYTSCYPWTTNEQKEAASLYKRYGFRLTEEKPSATFGKSLIEQRYDLKK